MKINTLGLSNLNNKHPIPFKAGITTFYSDFDGTFMPLSHNEVCSTDNLRDNEYKSKILIVYLLKFQIF